MDPTRSKPKVIGLYGVSGCGKTTLLEQLQSELPGHTWSFYEGSAVLSDVVGSGGLEDFGEMEHAEQLKYRQLAIETIQQKCQTTGTAGLVTGHGSLWDNGSVTSITTPADFKVYTHILYLDIPAEVVSQHSWDDTTGDRQILSVEELSRWQETEREQLRDDCIANNVLFCSLRPTSLDVLGIKIKNRIKDFTFNTEERNLYAAQTRLDDILKPPNGQLSTVLILDGDKTLSAVDTGTRFWEHRSKMPFYTLGANPLEKVFRDGYSYNEFRRATLLYEEACNNEEYETLCDQVASEVNMYSEFVSLLQLVAQQKKVKVVIVTSGLRRVWEKALEREGLSTDVRVIGGGRLRNGVVVTAKVKKALVARLRDHYGLQTWVFGDSPLDIDMLVAANVAVVVVGDEKTRSKSMEAELSYAIAGMKLSALQVLLPETSAPRLDTTKLPLMQLTCPTWINAILGGKPSPVLPTTLCAIVSNAAKLLTTPMRDAGISASNLREAHHQVGRFLALRHLSDIVGLEEYPITHVNDTQITGHRFLHEQQMTIVALMRGGEPMAFGVNPAASEARFMHANSPEDITSIHLSGQITMVLVDSVINSGKTVLEFIRHIRSMHATIRIVIVAGVVHADFVNEGKLDEFGNVSLIALRKSENKCTGSGATDTGNRLFNTTYLK